MEIIKIQNQNGIETVNGRELWTALESKRQYGNWIKEKLNIFTQDIDYIVFNNFVKDDTAFGGKRKIIEYYFPIDIAKQICMMENTEKGREVRKYFIECEKRLKEKPPLSIEQMTMIVISEMQKKIEEQKHKVEFYDAVSESETNITFRDFGRLLGIGQNTLFQKCRELKLIDNQNSPYQKYIDAGYFKEIEKAFQKKEKTLLYKQTLITGKGQIYIERKIKGANNE